jgi:transposase
MMQLWRLERTNQDITTLDRHINEKPEPYRTQDPPLMHIPSADWVVAAMLIAEVGADMSLFRSARHPAASAGVRPGSYESAGKQSARARKGNVDLRTILVGGATPASRTEGSYLKDSP